VILACLTCVALTFARCSLANVEFPGLSLRQSSFNLDRLWQQFENNLDFIVLTILFYWIDGILP
ncbi:hypothetical protein BgiBS90_017130, partial [Biomphalaria glabrata]